MLQYQCSANNTTSLAHLTSLYYLGYSLQKYQNIADQRDIQFDKDIITDGENIG